MTALAESYFKKSLKGYDTEQVDEFIISLSDTYEQNEKELSDEINALQKENERLKNEIAIMRTSEEHVEREHEAALAAKQKEYDILYAEIGEKMVLADQRAAEIIKNAEKEANLILTHARQSSENEAKAIRERAEEDANRLIEETRRKCENISAAADELRARQQEMNRSIIETESKFTSALNKLKLDIGEQE